MLSTFLFPWVETCLVQHQRAPVTACFAPLIVEDSGKVEYVQGFTNDDRLVDELIPLHDLLHVALETAADIQIANGGCSRVVKLTAD